jgi:sugar phosphate isomerase/epimerase
MEFPLTAHKVTLGGLPRGSGPAAGPRSGNISMIGQTRINVVFFRSSTMSRFFLLASLVVFTWGSLRADDATDTSAEVTLGWQLGVQAYSFNRFTFFEAVDKATSIGLKYIEAYPGQRISEDIDGQMGVGMSDEQIDAVKQKLESAGIQLVAFGVTGLSADEAESRKTFEWCKRMGVEVINTEVKEDAFDTLEKLCAEFNIKVGLHNHPEPSYYWNPDKVLDVLRGRSHMIGACADTGHWMRSGLDPVECLEKLEGRIVSMHFKDLNRMGRRAHDVPWGTGSGNLRAMLEELKRQGFAGPISAEYEHNWLNSLPEIDQSVRNFRTVAADLVR